jgi:hypothetical protein
VSGFVAAIVIGCNNKKAAEVSAESKEVAMATPVSYS